MTPSIDNSNVGVNVDLSTNIVSGGHADGDSIFHFEHLEGSNFSDVLVGDGFDNTIEGNQGDDNLTGGAGDDTFVFRIGDDADTINDFSIGAGSDDVIDLSDRGFADFAAVQSTLVDTGSDVLIDLDGVVDGVINGDAITLVGVADTSDLNADDVIV